MSLVALRHRLLIALGLPACWTGQAAAPPPVEPVPELPPAPRAVRDPVEFDRATCARDMVVETVCGTTLSGEQRCADTSDAIEVRSHRLHVTSHHELSELRDEFLFDGPATDAYLETLDGPRTTLFDRCCYSRCSPLVVGAATALPSRPPPLAVPGRTCIPAPPAGTTLPAAGNPACPAGVRLRGRLSPYESGSADECCYKSFRPRVIKGRPARVLGEPAFAALAEGTAWHAAVAPDVARPTADQRARLAAAWLEAARMEHASIAAFSNLSLRLLALGAPPQLVAAAHAAALDEIEHARVAFALASRYAGRAIAPDRFADLDRMTATGDVATLALETFVDGCIGEAVAAAEAERAAERAADPEIAAVLRRIAEDEARHAELAWAIVAWCLAREPALLGRLRAELARPGAAPTDRDEDLAPHGVLGERTREAIHAEVVREVVAPCLAALAA